MSMSSEGLSEEVLSNVKKFILEVGSYLLADLEPKPL